MLPHKHVIISSTIGAIGWGVTRDPAMAVAALLAGVLPDVDHLVDYSYYYWRGEHRLILPLHGYEFALLAAFVAFRTGNKILGVTALSYLIHLWADQTENRTHIFGYALLFRIWNRFRIEQLSTVPEDAIRGRMQDIDLLKSLVQRWRRRLDS